jgi:hypothetical protein
MSFPNRDGAEGTRAALLATNPAHAAPDLAARVDDHEDQLANHEDRLSSLEGDRDGQSEHSDATDSGDDS